MSAGPKRPCAIMSCIACRPYGPYCCPFRTRYQFIELYLPIAAVHHQRRWSAGPIPGSGGN
jgi:hypothetical protein